MLQCLTKNVVEFCATNGWKCPDVSLKTPSFPATNTAGNVVKSRQKYPVLMPQILLEMSRRSIKTIEWFHTYRDEMQPGTAERKVRSYRKVKMMWQKCMTRTNSNISVFRGNVNCQHFTPATEPTQRDWSSSLCTNEPLEWRKKWRDHQKTTLTNHSDSENSDTVAWGWGQLVAMSHCNLDGWGQLTGPRQSQL